MRKADRLFQIVQILRRESAPVTAQTIADELETSKRSVYRDIAALIGQRVPITGEAGVGYILEAGFDLPPLMLDTDEIDAVAIGLQWVARRSDAHLGRAAQSALAKVAAVLPPNLRAILKDPTGGVPPAWHNKDTAIDVASLRSAIRSKRRIFICYENEHGERTDRTVWPLLIGYSESALVLIAWCELREDFRSFRLDRIKSIEFLSAAIPQDPAALRRRWRSTLRTNVASR